jgi:hypothetical protein
MTIRQVGPMTEITPGQWVLQTPLMRDHISDPPREVIRRSGKRVYFKNRHNEDEGDYCSVATILALCDTKAEADELYAISAAQYQRLMEVRKDHETRFKALIK